MGDADQSAWVEVPDADVAAQVQNLLQVYALWVDAGRRDDIATLFTEDAEWDGTELGYGAATGAADIARHLAAFHLVSGVAVLAVSLVTNYQYSPKRGWNQGVAQPQAA